MSDIASTIRIDDGFTEPLQDLTVAAIRAADKVESLKDSLEGLSNVDLDEFGNYFDAATLLAGKRFEKLVKRISKSATDTADKIAKQVKRTTLNIKFEVLYITSFMENKIEQFSKKAMFSIKWKVFYLTDLMRTKMTEVRNFATKAFSKEGLNKVAGSLGTAFGKVWGGITNLNKLIPILLDNIKTGITDAILKIPAAMQKVSSQASALGSSVKKGLLTGMSKVPGIMKNITSKSKDEIKNLKKELFIAKNIFIERLTENRFANAIRGEINGYQRYRNVIWDQQDALKNVPQKLNMADKIGRRGNILARRLEVAGFDRAAKFLYNKSDNLIAKHGFKPPKIEDPSVMGYVKKRAAEVKTSIATQSKEGFTKGLNWLRGTEAYKITKSVALDFGSMVGISILSNMALSALDKLKDKIVGMVLSTRRAIQNSLEEVSTRDKMKAIYGSAGDSAVEHSYMLANELGESASMVSQLSQNALSAGIGTQSFEKIMRLSDKIGKLKLGANTESVASELMSNIYNGGDIEHLSSVLGLNKEQQKSLKDSGYEKLIKKGDLEGALDIANKIAEQAGYTNEKYDTASNSLSQNYKKIENILSNVKRRMSEIYVESLAPVVEKFRRFLESEKVQTIIRIIEVGVRHVGSFVSDLLDTIMENLGTIGVILGVTMVSKFYLLMRSIQGTLAFIPMIKSGLVWIFTKLGFTGIAGALKDITWKTFRATVLTKIWAGIKIAAGFAAVGAAIGGILYAIYDCTAETDKWERKTKTFSQWLGEALVASYAGAVAIFHNVFVWFERVFSYIKSIPKLLFAAFKDFGKQETFTKKVRIVNVAEDKVKGMTAEELKKKGIMSWSNNGKTGYFRYETEEIGGGESEVKKVLDEIKANQTEYLDVEKEVQKAIDSGNSLLDYIKGLIGIQGKKQDGVEGKLGKIGEDTHGIASSMSQEDELSWMKAFSDRQIMSSYSSTTTNNRTINMNGVSQNVMAEAYRRDRNTIPARSR